MIDLLKTKWNVFVKAKFYSQFYMFSIYFFISMFAFGLRPRAFDGKIKDGEESANRTLDVTINDTTNAPVKTLILHNLTESICNYSATYQESLMQAELDMMNVTNMYDNITSIGGDTSDEWASFSECPLLDISTLQNRVSDT